MTVSNIRSKKTKNQLRGLQGKDANSATLKTLNLLRQETSLEDAGAVANWLYGSALFKGLSLPVEFPKQPANFDRYVSLETASLQVEIAMLCSRLATNEGKLLQFIETYKEINILINEEHLGDAQSLIERTAEEYGHSIRILLKASYIYTHPSANPNTVTRCKIFLDSCGMGQRNFVARGAVDMLSADYNFLSIRRNIASRERAGNRTAFSNDIGEWLFFPIQRTQLGFSAQLRSQRQASLIDAAFTLFENVLNLDGGDRFKLNVRSMTGLVRLCAAWDGLASKPTKSLMKRSEGSKDKTFQIYRDSIAWLEIASITRFRARVDALYRDPKSRNELEDEYSRGLNRLYYRGVNSLKELCVDSSNDASLQDYFDPKSESIFGRTLAVLNLMQSPYTEKKLDTSDLLALMNTTSDIDTLLGESDLDILLEHGDGAPLFQVIILTLKSQHTGSPRAASRLRTAFENLVCDSYHSDLRAFFSDLNKKATVVAQYLFELCDERFLELLYEVVPEDASVLQIRADLLLWYSETYGEKTYAERARIMQIDARIQQVRGAIDDTRIYVDKVRFAHWIQDNYLDEIAAISREEVKLTDIAVLGGFGGQEDSYLPEVRMAKVLQAAYKEFCENTHFGIASYLGRRIRHGTLAGVLISKIEESISTAKENDFSENLQAQRYLDTWLEGYKKNVNKLGADYLQVYSPKAKPHGLLNTNIWETPKVDITRGSLRGLFEVLESDNIMDMINGIIQSCWQLIQLDLVRIRGFLISRRTHWGTLDATEFARASHAERKAVSAFCATTNNLTDELFKSVVSWFHQPQEMVPSAPLTLLFDAVMKEVQEAFPNFDPILEPQGVSEVTLTGGTYHIVYDALYILLGNAAKHGKQPIKIRRKLEFVRDKDNHRELLVVVATGCSDAQATKIKDKMNEALSGDNSDANSLDHGSGFKKLAHLRDTTRELKRVEYSIENGEFGVNLFFELLA
ncbi:MAG: hypothetical protein P1U75_14330 [Antarcticimicrobium sp.]|uniref:hypothetical protein n=1 Tax=Antarcticimicrobium sp. TaxID=2824147 RepID=UPI002633BB33|nr:hypothetical protein [Antarcticimicrobium sp.]MDF1717829.1 hypothetical protein [Antarcticimicrobium sp.]